MMVGCQRPELEEGTMQTSLRIDGANCPTCFNETLDALGQLDGVRSVTGSFAGPCIEIDHDVALEAITGRIRERLHGIEMFANEIRMVALEPVELTGTCVHHRLPDPETTM
jgi:copper chaperone CopZ